MENEFKQYEMNNKISPSEEAIIQNRLDSSYKENILQKAKPSFFSNVFFKLFLVLISFIGVGAVVILLRPSVNTSNNNIAIIQTVSAKEVLNKMVLKLEDLKKNANFAFMHYTYSSNENADYTNKDIYIYKDLAGKGYSTKAVRTANQETISRIQEDGSTVTQYFPKQTQYFMQDGQNEYSFIASSNDPYTLQVSKRMETDNAILLNVNPLREDPIEAFSSNYKIITDNLNLVSTDNAELVTFNLNGEDIPAYKITFGFDYQNFMYSSYSYIDSKFNMEVLISKETLLPLRETINGFGTDNEPLQIQVDYLDFAYENRLPKDASKIFNIDTALATMGYTNYKISDSLDLESGRYYFDKTKEVTYTGKVIAKSIGEKYVLPTLKVESNGEEIFLEGDNMYDWLAEKPTTIGYYLIGKKIEVKGYETIEDSGYKQIIVNLFRILE